MNTFTLWSCYMSPSCGINRSRAGLNNPFYVILLSDLNDISLQGLLHRTPIRALVIARPGFRNRFDLRHVERIKIGRGKNRSYFPGIDAPFFHISRPHLRVSSKGGREGEWRLTKLFLRVRLDLVKKKRMHFNI